MDFRSCLRRSRVSRSHSSSNCWSSGSVFSPDALRSALSWSICSSWVCRRADFVALAEGSGGGEAGLGGGGEAVAEVGQVEEAVEILGGEFGLCGEGGGGSGGGGGEVEIHLESEGLVEGVEGGEEGWASEPAAEDGGVWPIGGGGAGGVVAKGA